MPAWYVTAGGRGERTVRVRATLRAMRILVLQARLDDDPMLGHEQQCFVSATGLPLDALVFRNLVGGVPGPDEVRAHDALMIGGSGRFSVAHPDADFFEPTRDLLRWVVERSFPTFGSCFGYQLLVDALGGRVEHDPDNGEVGSFELELTEAGAADPLFADLPKRFIAQMGHLDRATTVPATLPNLASSPRSPYQALRVPGAPIWATQFHPELDQRSNHERYMAYIERYGGGERDSEYRALPSPESSALLRRFLDRVVRP
jgi:GMP synthase (glutamine-hydrolysing)